MMSLNPLLLVGGVIGTVSVLLLIEIGRASCRERV